MLPPSAITVHGARANDLSMANNDSKLETKPWQMCVSIGCFLPAAAAAVLAVGYLSVAPPAHAAPPGCTQYAFGGPFVITGANIGEVTVNAAKGTKLAGDTLTISDDGAAVRGFVPDGAIAGRKVNFVIAWFEESETRWTFAGNVGNDGLVRGGVMHGPGFMSLWDSTTPLACNDPVVATKRLPDSIVVDPAPASTRVPVPVSKP